MYALHVSCLIVIAIILCCILMKKEKFQAGRVPKLFDLGNNVYGLKGMTLPTVGATIQMPEISDTVFVVTGRFRKEKKRKRKHPHFYTYVTLSPLKNVPVILNTPYRNVYWKVYPNQNITPYGYYPYGYQPNYPWYYKYPTYYNHRKWKWPIYY